jgi:hypothetical protein
MLLFASSCRLCAQNPLTTQTQLFSPQKEKRKRAKEEKKDMQVKKQCSGGCQGFLKKNTTRRVAQVWRFFFKNPQGLTFTAGKWNC